MPKTQKTISLVVNGVSEKDLPFLGNKFESLDEVSTHPNCVGENDIPNMTGKQFSIMGRINYATDLQERSKVRPVWFSRLEGPSKAFATAAKAQVKLAASLGKELSLETALAQVYTQMGVDPQKLPTVDKTTPVDIDSIGEDESEVPETVETGAGK